MQTADRLAGIGEYYFSLKLREIDELNKAGRAVINLGIGSPDGAPHPEVVRVLEEESRKAGAHGYQGYKGVPALRDAISGWYRQWYDVVLDPATEVLPLIGSKEGIVHVCMTYLSAGDEALVPNPGYPAYGTAVRLAGAAPKFYHLDEENGWFPQLEALEKEDLSKVKLMWVNYPHMPTGQRPKEGLFEDLIRFGAKWNILICHDNPYSFILNDTPVSILSVPGAMDTAIELNSLSKSHNMAGWRVGMLCGARERIEDVLRFKSNMDSGMFLPLQLAAARALGLGSEWFATLNETYGKRRTHVFQLLDILKCTYAVDQTGLFVWAKVPPHFGSGFALSDAVLKEASVFLTPGGIFGTAGEGYVRVSLCSNEINLSRAVEQISKIEAWS